MPSLDLRGFDLADSFAPELRSASDSSPDVVGVVVAEGAAMSSSLIS